MPSNTGYGTSIGKNFGGGGVIYITDINPTPNTQLNSNDAIEFTISVNGSLIDLSTIQITLAGETGFIGSTASFGTDFSAFSSYQYVPSANGYSFSFTRTGGYTNANVTVEIYAETTDGGTTTQSYSVTTVPAAQYPSTPFDTPMTDVKMNLFSGESQEGLLAGAAGQVFFTPGLENADPSVQLDVDDVEVKTYAAEAYQVKQIENKRPFVWGPPFDPVPPNMPAFPPVVSNDYLPILNDGDFGFLTTTDSAVRGVLHDTISLEDTLIFY